jgi:hypothetical protein
MEVYMQGSTIHEVVSHLGKFSCMKLGYDSMGAMIGESVDAISSGIMNQEYIHVGHVVGF